MKHVVVCLALCAGTASSECHAVATHTHGGPEYYGPLRDVLHARALQQQGRDHQEQMDDQVQLVERWVDVIRQAQAAQCDATLSVVVPYQLGLPFNRRYLMNDDSTGWIPGKLNPLSRFGEGRPGDVNHLDVSGLEPQTDTACSDQVAPCLDGDSAIVALPQEVFTELGLAIKSGSPFRTAIVLSLARASDFCFVWAHSLRGQTNDGEKHGE